ncbi:hypothetical protein EMIHUDRAFT_246141 [Emiliania huxleyi CCMP1516]|uniref:non-specific protein-tyrosine kinase n=2 Tax=Emiliania huxleyi TaxID=2903 RepID=A0A0D3IUZ8_EMIH1|nr:hypothetical protein EMIHUDRAFT_246141 [Emiliania huxleyi CCMP1516]EOD15083.1 hypothetical protein EMIHUDRAFT_246141 [Emiliania huxleyi CCMP1516]|eukprot:XP_005767512.1 hypothetical protein EMIHUDRAFT_246141 [Emiliania huxleyi CCMP1516]
MGAFVIVSGCLAESAFPRPGGNFSDGNAGEVMPVEDSNVVSVQPRSGGAPPPPPSCDCGWTTKYPCPGSPSALEGAWGQELAKDDGSACFDLCCKKPPPPPLAPPLLPVCKTGCAWTTKYPCPTEDYPFAHSYDWTTEIAEDDGSACFDVCCKMLPPPPPMPEFKYPFWSCRWNWLVGAIIVIASSAILEDPRNIDFESFMQILLFPWPAIAGEQTFTLQSAVIWSIVFLYVTAYVVAETLWSWEWTSFYEEQANAPGNPRPFTNAIQAANSNFIVGLILLLILIPFLFLFGFRVWEVARIHWRPRRWVLMLCDLHPYKQFTPEGARGAAGMTAAAPKQQVLPDVQKLLVDANLEAFSAGLARLGVRGMSDLRELEDDDLAQLSMQSLEVKRLRRRLDDGASQAPMGQPVHNDDLALAESEQSSLYPSMRGVNRIDGGKY